MLTNFNALDSRKGTILRRFCAHLTILGLWLATAAHAGGDLHPNAEMLKAAGGRTLTLSRFRGHNQFFSAQTLEWNFADGKYSAGNRLHTTHQIGFDGCESMLAKHQYFPLNKMTSTGYLPPGDILKYVKMSLQFNPAIVSMMLTNRTLKLKEAQSAFGDDWQKRLNPYLENKPDFSDPEATGSFVTGSMWLAGAQYLDPKSGVVKKHNLPWQYDPERKELSEKFDRKRYPIVFEWGRTAQDLPGEVNPVASLLSALTYHEVLAIGAPIEDSYVMMHSFDELNTKLYARYFPGTIYPADWNNPSDTLFLIPLAQVMKRFPPHSSSQRIHDLIEAATVKAGEQSTAHLDSVTAMNLTLVSDFIQSTLLDVKNPNGSTYLQPIAIRDRTIVADVRLAHAIHRVGFELSSPNGIALRTAIAQRPVTGPQWNAGQYSDLADYGLTDYFYRPQNAIEISNLDAELAKLDRFYIQRILLAVFNRYRDMGHEVPGLGLEFLAKRDVEFGITTMDESLADRIRLLKPKREELVPAAHPGQGDSELDWSFRASYHAQYMFIFSLAQILALEYALPGLPLYRLEENIWQRDQQLSDPEPF